MKKAIRKLMIGLILVLSSLFVRTPIKAADFSVSNFVDLQSALSDGDASINITVTASFDITALLVIPTGKTVSITSEGGPFTLKRAAGLIGDLLTVQTGATLTLTNIILDGNKDNVESDGSLVYNQGNLTLGTGSVLQNNNAGGIMEGAGLRNAAGGIAVIDGGVIQNNNNPGRAGGGVWSAGDLTMNSGEIKNNQTAAGGGGVAILNGGTFTFNGGTISGNVSRASGGGIYIGTGSILTMHGGTIDGNSTTDDYGFGGGIYLYTSDAASVIDGGTISNNTASNGGGIDNNATLTITNATISGNTANKLYVYGGGIENTKNLTLGEGTIITGNSATYGAGVFNNIYGNLTVDGAVITGNTGANGAGVFNWETMVMNSGEISGNTGTNGGGIYNYKNLTINGGEINDNTANNGGGVVNASNMTMNGGEISGNSASNVGGGVYNAATMLVNDGTISDNTAASGGGIYNANDLTINDGEISGNTATTSAGGGIMHKPSSPPKVLHLNGGRIKNNHAATSGGGVGVTMDDLASVEVGAEVAFSGNSIEGKSYSLDDGDQAAYEEAVEADQWSKPYINGYNNADISYTKGNEVEVVTFDVDGDKEAVDPVLVEPGGLVTRPTDPQKTHYTFDGWYSNDTYNTAWDFASDVVNGNVTLYGRFIAQAKVSYMSHGAEIDSAYLDKGTALARPSDPVLSGHTFVGWYSDSSLTTPYDFDTLVTADLILYAKWEPHKVELISNGSKLSEFLVDDDSTLALPPNPIRSGYTFGGWYLDEACTIPFDAEMKIEEDMKLYAKWIPAGGSSASAGAGVGGEVYTGYDNQAGFWLTMSGLALLVLLKENKRNRSAKP